MAHRSQCSDAGDNPLDPNYLPPHYREEYRMAIDALVDADLEGYYGFLQEADVVDFLSHTEIEYIKCMVQAPRQSAQPERRYMAEDADGSSDTYWPVHSDHEAPSLDLGWPLQFRFVGPTEVTTLVNPSDPETPSIKEQVRRMIKNAQQVIAVVMDMFTDVDIFADILNAATRGVAVYVLLDEQNAHHFVAMANNCRVNLDEIKSMRVRTVTGSTYYCRKGNTFKGQMMDRFILVDCRAVLSGNYSFMWSFEKIHRCLAHLFLGQLVMTFDEEFRILFAHSEPLVVENILANMPQYGGEPESYYNTEKTHMFNRQYPSMGVEWAERTAEDHMNIGHKMLPLRSDSVHSATEVNPPIQRHMNIHVAPQYRGDHQFIEQGRQMRGPAEMAGFKRHSYANIPDFEYLPPTNHPTMRGNQYMEGQMPQGGHFGREPLIYPGPGLQSGYDMYGRFRGQGHHIDQFSGSGYPDEGGEAELSGSYDHVQRYLQSHSPMEEGHGPRNPPKQLNLKRQSVGHSYTCQTSPTQPNLPEQKRFFGINRKPQDVSQKQGLRDWRISSYLSAYDDAGDLDLAELEGSRGCDEVPCFTQEVPCGPVHVENRPENREFIRENSTFFQIQNESIVPENSFSHPTNVSQLNMKTTPISTSESSCTTEGDKAEEMQNKEPKEVNRIGDEFLKRKSSRPVQRSSRLRHSLIFSSNLELPSSDEMKDTAGEKDGDDASKLSERVLHKLDKRRTGSPFQPFQWSNFVKSATFDNTATESAQPEDEQNKMGMGENTDLDKIETSPNLRRNSLKDILQEKDLSKTIVPEGKSHKQECPSNVLQKSSSIDMNDPDCRLKYFKELAAKRKLAAAKVSQSNPLKATQKFALPEKPSTNDADKKTAPVFKTPETPLKSKNTTPSEVKETCKGTKCEESSKDILQRATDAEKIRLKKILAEESGKNAEEARTLSTAKNQTSTVLNIFTQKPLEPFSRNSEPLCAAHAISGAFNTAKSGTTQYHIPKETDPSHVILTESGPPVMLPQTKYTSPESITPYEGCLSELSKSQIFGESLPFITCSDIVALDSNSTPNLANVDTFIPTNIYHIDMGPSSLLSTTEISSSKHSTAIKIDSSQSFREITADFSGDSTEAQTKSSVAEKNSPQMYTLEKADISKQHATREIVPSQKSSGDIQTSQHPSTLKTNCFKHPAPLKGFISHHSTSADSETSQNIFNVKESASFQQPPAAELSQNSTGLKSTFSQHPTKTKEDLSQFVAKSGTEISQHTTPAQMTSTRQSAASVIESPHLYNAKNNESFLKPTSIDKQMFIPTDTNLISEKTDSSQQPTASATGSSHHSPQQVTDSSLKMVALEIDPSQKPISRERVTSQQSAALVVDANQQHPLANETYSSSFGTEAHFAREYTKIKTGLSHLHIPTIADSSQKFSAAETESSLQSTATESDSFQKLTVAETDSSFQSTATESVSFQKPTVAETESPLQFTATKSDSFQKPIVAETGSSLQSTATETDSFQKSTVAETESCLQPIATESDSFQKPTTTEAESSIHFTATEADSSQNPIGTEAESSFQFTATRADLSHKPATAETESSLQSTATESDFFQNPTVAETKSSLQSTATESDSFQKPTVTETESFLQSTATESDSFQKPTVAETESSLQSTATKSDSFQKPSIAETESSLQSTATESDFFQKPTVAETECLLQSTATESDSFQKPTVAETECFLQSTATESDYFQKPSIAETESSLQSTATESDSFQKPTVAERESSLQSTATKSDSFQKPTVAETESSLQSTVTETDSLQKPTAAETESSLLYTATESDSFQKPTVAETESSLQSTASELDSFQKLTIAETESSLQSTATESDSFQKPIVAETESSLQSTAIESDSFQKPIVAETESSHQSTVTESVSVAVGFCKESESYMQSTATESDSSQNLKKAETESKTKYSLQSTATDSDSFQKPTETETKSSLQSTGPEADSFQKPTTTTEAESSIHFTATKADSFQNPIGTEAESCIQFTATQADLSHKPATAETGSLLQSKATESDSFQKLTIADSYQQSTANEADPSQKHFANAIDSFQQSTAHKADSSHQPAPAEIDFWQKSTATVADPSPKSLATVIDSFQCPSVTETKISLSPALSGLGPSQQLTPLEKDSSQHHVQLLAESSRPSAQSCANSSQQLTADSSQQHISLEAKSSQPPVKSEPDFSQQPSADSFQQHTSLEAESFQPPVQSEPDFSQQPSAYSSQQHTLLETESSKPPVQSAPDFFQQPTADFSQQHTQLEEESSLPPCQSKADPSHQQTLLNTESSQPPVQPEPDFPQQPTTVSSQQHTQLEEESFLPSCQSKAEPLHQQSLLEADSSQPPVQSEPDFSQQPIAHFSQQHTQLETESSQPPVQSEPDFSQQPTADSSQQHTQLEEESSLPLCDSEADSSHQQTLLEKESSQPAVQSAPDFSQQPTADSSQQHTQLEEESSLSPCQSKADPSHQQTLLETESSQSPVQPEPDFPQQPTTGSSHQHTQLEKESSLPPVKSEPDFSQQPTPSETDSSSNLYFPSSPLHQRQTPHQTSTDSLQQPVIIETHSTQELTVIESPKIPTKTGLGTYKHPIETEKETLQHMTATKSYCVNEEKDDHLTEDFSKVIPIPPVNISETDNRISQNTAIKGLCSPVEQLQSHTVTSCDSQVKLHHTKPPGVKDKDNSVLTSLNSVVVSSTQPEGLPDLCSTSNEINSTEGITQLKSSISSTSNFLNDQKLEKTDECQQNGTIAKQLQRHDAPAIAEESEITNRDVSTAIECNEDDRTKQTTSDVENSQENFKSAEVSDKSDLTNSKLSISPHQLSTANVISCSNLRDDTKVLLEQISAKNRSSKQNAVALKDGKQGEVSSPDKVFSNYLGRPWSSKATQEEREMLLQKMEKMRKERKVYSRFEAS